MYYDICNVTNQLPISNLHFQLSIDETDNNRIDFITGLPNILTGAGVSLNLYLLVLYNNDYISSTIGVNPNAINLWHGLLRHKSIYGMTNNKMSVAINKNISDEKLINILNHLPKNLELDEELEEKIIQLYGTMDTYKQRN